MVVSHKWEKIQITLVSVGRDILKPHREKIKRWMTGEMIYLTEERRKKDRKKRNAEETPEKTFEYRKRSRNGKKLRSG